MNIANRWQNQLAIYYTLHRYPKVAAPDPARDIGVQKAALKLKQPNLG